MQVFNHGLFCDLRSDPHDHHPHYGDGGLVHRQKDKPHRTQGVFVQLTRNPCGDSDTADGDDKCGNKKDQPPKPVRWRMLIGKRQDTIRNETQRKKSSPITSKYSIINPLATTPPKSKIQITRSMAFFQYPFRLKRPSNKSTRIVPNPIANTITRMTAI